MRITGFESNDEILAELGSRIRDMRIAMPLTMDELAQKAGVAPKTLANIEKGKGSTLGSVVSVLRALGQAGNLEALVPEQGARPSDLAALGKKRQRARRALKDGEGGWKWGDER
ncbi:MAG: helix-turn-helix domain-containing protein [Eggerthellaceae bacterium]|nr:helix-turn-helix domain-containing protein [Eggerthellaceae bacterium]